MLILGTSFQLGEVGVPIESLMPSRDNPGFVAVSGIASQSSVSLFDYRV